MQAKVSTSVISNLESVISEMQGRVSILQTTMGQLEADSTSADDRCFMHCSCLLHESQHSAWLHCSVHINLNVMKHHGTHIQTQQGGNDVRVSVHLDVDNPCVLVDFAEAVDEPNMIKPQCGMAVPTVSLAMAQMHPLHVISVCMVSWLGATAFFSLNCS